MTRSITFSVQRADLVQFEADVIGLKYARGLFGAARAVAGALGKSEAALEQHLPSVGSMSMFPGLGRIKAKQALFIRVVQLSAFDYGEIRQFSYDFLKGLRSLFPEARHLATTIHGTGFGLSVSKTVHAEVYGCIEAIKAGEYPPYLEKVSIVDIDEASARRFESRLLEILPGREVKVPGPPAPTPETGEAETTRPAQVPQAFDVFISYKSEDESDARRVYEFLRAHGLRAFFSRESLPQLGSEEYHEQIDLAIEKARHMIVVTTSGEHVRAKWVDYEWRLFLGEKLAGRKTGKLISVVAGDMPIKDLPIGLRHRQALELTGAGLERLLEFIKSGDD